VIHTIEGKNRALLTAVGATLYGSAWMSGWWWQSSAGTRRACLLAARWCVFRMNVTGRFGIVTGDFGNVTGHFGNVTDRTGRQDWRCAW